jgi:hypothetical protein
MAVERVLFVNPLIAGVTPVVITSSIAPKSIKLNKATINLKSIKQFKNNLKTKKNKLTTNKVKIDMSYIKRFKEYYKNKTNK